MEKAQEFFKEYTAMCIFIIFTIIPALSQFLPDVAKSGPIENFILKSFGGIMFSFCIFFIMLITSKIYSAVKSDVTQFSMDYNINLFGLLNSKSFIDSSGVTIYCTKNSNTSNAESAREVHVHRIDGPAIKYKDGRVVWALYDSKMEFHEFINKTPLSKKAKAKLKEKYAEYLV